MRILFILLYTVTLHGAFYGSVGLTYISNEYSNKTKNAQKNFMQEYKLGYKGNIYSPKLVDYSVMGILRYEDIKSEINDVSGKTRIQSEDYKLDFNFLKNSKIPFKIYAKKSTRPVSVVYANTVNRSFNDIESAGISGAVKLNIFNIAYGASHGSGVYESLISTENRENTTYKASIRKSEKNYNFQLGYSNISQIFEREYADMNKSITDNTEDNINLLYRLDINDDFTFNTYSYYRENEYRSDKALSTTTTSATASLRWNPKTKHSGSVSLQSFNVEDDYYTMKNISMNQDYKYRITKDLIFSQQTNYSVVDTNSITSENIGVGSGLNYTKPISNITRINLSLNANIRSNSNDRNSSLDADTYRYYIRTGINQKINSINSSLSVSVGYDGSNSTLDEYNERSNANLSFVTKISSKMSNNFNTSYHTEKTRLKYGFDFLDRDVETINIRDNINYRSRIGLKGNIRVNAGVNYSYTNNNNVLITRIMPKCDINFNYRFWQRVAFKSTFHIDKDLTYDITTSRFDNLLSFNSRYTVFSLGYNYNKIIAGVNSEISGRDGHVLQAKFVRKF